MSTGRYQWRYFACVQLSVCSRPRHPLQRRSVQVGYAFKHRKKCPQILVAIFSQTQEGVRLVKRGRPLSPFLGFSGALSVGLKHSGGLLNYSGEKLQGKIYQKINLLIPYCQFYLGLLWGIRWHNPRTLLGLFL